ncbi:MAG: RNA polymerase factor sigma-54 [Bacteroidales bacterium]|nr:RNA polymerase factor sigma-54 [Bacteroidales bacterium]HOY38505.1 RNA polymerase factor sigma-54 [Bacteroidales bacterium]HQP04146.1 RNA polymerase factor sigma-54 [Bacteroidales bacterium]
MLKQSLQQKLLQKLSPQQIQMIKLLELPTLQLEQRIKKELEENPALEEGADEDENTDTNEDENEEQNENDDEFSLEDYIDDEDDIPAYRLQVNNFSKDDERKEIPFSAGISFHENLKDQLGLKQISPRDRVLAEFLIGSMDEDGYIHRDLESIADDLAFNQNISATTQEIENALYIVQDLDPPGIGARNLRECLLIQLDRKEKKTLPVLNAHEIIFSYFEEFTKKHYDRIMQRLELSEPELKQALEMILRLNPKPGSSYSDSSVRSAQTIVPDFILENYSGKLELSLNARNAPELRLSRDYSEMLQGLSKSKDSGSRSEKDAVVFIKQKLDSAKWFIDAIKQRQNTLLITMNAILEYQKDFFIQGDETLLKPMILKDIAEKTGLDISTISRVANSKYIQTPFGNYLLKHFFSEAMQTDSGEEVSTREIKQILKECIENENKRRPLTDDKLASILKEKKYVIARRTVAKYREQLGIPVARLRKKL